MKFEKIIPHLAKRGFVTRKCWNRKAVMVFGMDNVPYMQCDDNSFNRWSPCLEEIKSTDWIKLPYFWDRGNDDFLPFKKGWGPPLVVVNFL